MKVYIQSYKSNMIHNINFYTAFQGFREMGFEIVLFHEPSVLQTSQRGDVVVGYVNTVRSRLLDLDIEIHEMDYPKELMKYMGRKTWTSTINTINSNPDIWPVFVKPVEDKKFTGVVVRSSKDLIGCGSCRENAEVICSEVVDFKAEWRCFVRYGKILDVRQYKGDWRLHFDPNIIEASILEYTSAPNGYAIDFGVTKDNQTLLIEVNDGYALGSYGLQYLDYAKLLSARWAELTGTEDECDF